MSQKKDHYTFLGTCPSTPPLSQHFADPKKPLDITQMCGLLQNIFRDLSLVPAPLMLVGQESVTNR